MERFDWRRKGCLCTYSRSISKPFNHPQYLPWHRVYLRLFDNALRKECEYQGSLPYWDISIDPLKAPKFWETLSEVSTHFGVNHFVFAQNPQSPIPNHREVKRGIVPNGHFVGIPRLQIQVKMKKELYDDIWSWLERSHARFLQNFKGDLGNIGTAPNDPLYYLLQRYIDQLWYQWQLAWQKQNPKIAMSYSLGQLTKPTRPTDMMVFPGLYSDPLTVQDALNPVGGGVNGLMCYQYQDPIATKNL